MHAFHSINKLINVAHTLHFVTKKVDYRYATTVNWSTHLDFVELQGTVYILRGTSYESPCKGSTTFELLSLIF